MDHRRRSNNIVDARILAGDSPLDKAAIAPESVTTLPELFSHKARVQPHATAFSITQGSELELVSYQQAHCIASSLGDVIAQHCGRAVTTNEAPTVAIWLEKGLDLILAILGTTYSGATWLPLDPDVPAERAATCVEDASVSLVICDDIHEERAWQLWKIAGPSMAAAGKPRLICRTFAELRSESEAAGESTKCLTEKRPRPGDAAYLIYTSGTTGTPKGIAIPHSAALMFALSEQLVLETGPEDIVWNGFSPAFDMFVEEMWVTIAGGGHLTIGTREECQDVPGLPALWQSRGVTLVNAVPTLIGIMEIARADDRTPILPSSIRLVNLGGEACPPGLVNRLARPGLRILNTYGPTETTVTATWEEVQPDVPITIGKPLPGYHACLLPIDDNDPTAAPYPLVLAPGVEGELAIGGPCVGLGYVGRPEQTARSFIQHPLLPGTPERLYRTGDRVQINAEYKIVFLGRIDTQVKHRGFRIELGEIEAKLYDVHFVQAAAVILTNPGTKNARLEAFVVVRPGADCDTTSIGQQAFTHLPSYMRPEKVWLLGADEMPRLPSGKINAKALQAVSAMKMAELMASVEPQNDDSDSLRTLTPNLNDPLGMLISTLHAVFPQAHRISEKTDIFDDLGGHSMTIAILVSKLRQLKTADDKCLFASIGLSEIYEGRTPERIASRFAVMKASSIASDSTAYAEDIQGDGPMTGDFLPISRMKFVVCGFAQIVPLIFIFFLSSVEILVPYLLFDCIVRTRNVGYAVIAAYGVFVAIPPCLTVIAIASKWILLGKVKPGEYPLYGVYYFRWWLAGRLVGLVNPKLTAESPLYPYLLRALGAKVGDYCHLGVMSVGPCADLVEIGDDVVVGGDTLLGVSIVERGRLVLKKVVIHSGAIIGSNSVIEGGAIIGEGSQIASLSLVTDGLKVPEYEKWHGSPAHFESMVKDGSAESLRASRPSYARAFVMGAGNMFIIGLVLPLLYFLPQLPGLMLFDALDLRSIHGWGQVAVLSLPIAFLYQFLVFGQLLFFRHLVLGRLREGTYKVHSYWYLRKWFIDRLMDLALDVLHPVFASLYIVPFLRMLGVKIGNRAEVSNARGLQFELLEIGEESFVADQVLMGDTSVKRNELTLMKTKLESRAFAGNASILPQGTVLASGSLVGVLSIAPPPEKPLREGSSCFGSPPVLMPTRQRFEGHQDSVLFHPSKGRVAARLLIEGMRIILPRALMVFGLGFALQVCYEGYHGIGVVPTLLLLPAIYFFMFALPALLITAFLKWVLIGRYTPAEWPLWSLDVWLSEAVTSTWETIAEPLLASILVGTPFLAPCFRLMGVKIGSNVTLLSSDITEYDCVTIMDEAIINQHCGAQTHLFEDRVMKVGNVTIGRRACLKPFSICLPGSSVSDNAQLGCLSLLMKNENLPAGTAWEGAPVVPRERRKVLVEIIEKGEKAFLACGQVQLSLTVL